MKDSNYERPESDNPEGVSPFSDRDLEDNMKPEENFAEGE